MTYTNPTLNEIRTINGTRMQWDGTKWKNLTHGKHSRRLESLEGFTTEEDAASGALASQVYINNADNTSCRHNRFGLSGLPETAVYAVFVGDQTQDTELSGNKVEVLKSGGAAFVGGSSTSFDINVHGSNNIVAAGITKWTGSPLYTIGEDGRKTFTRSATPTTDTWEVGDRMYYDTPTTHIGAVCTTAGSVGSAVWTNFGALA